MVDVNLGFKAFDLHELLCHFVAERAGLYEAGNIRVRLLDTTFLIKEELPDVYFQVACGAALAEWLQGAALNVVLAATDRPMFWLYGGESTRRLEDIRGKSIASFPDAAPPALFLRSVLERAGIGPEEVRLHQARDDIARLGLLASGHVEAALVSSAFPPPAVAERGIKPLLMLGDQIRVPTTGLAVATRLREEQPELVAAMVAIHARALELIHTDDGTLKAVLAETFRIAADAMEGCCELVRHCFTPAGIPDDSVIDGVLERAGARQTLPGNPLYDFSLLAR
jgi:hypothetical protein